MPSIKGIIDISISTGESQTLAEYGNTRMKNSLYSCFVVSEDKVPFQIWFKPIQSLFSNLDDYRTNRHRDDELHWDLAVHIYIDNKTTPEKSIVVDLPQRGVPATASKTEGRRIIGQDGSPMVQLWMFNEIPVEAHMANLSTNENLDETRGGESVEGCEDRAELGQIKIVLYRFRQCFEGYTNGENPDFPESRQDLDLSRIDPDISHVIGVGETKYQNYKYMYGDFVDGDDKPWATVIFMYRGKKSLQKRGFIPADGPMKRLLHPPDSNQNLKKRGFQTGNDIIENTERGLRNFKRYRDTNSDANTRMDSIDSKASKPEKFKTNNNDEIVKNSLEVLRNLPGNSHGTNKRTPHIQKSITKNAVSTKFEFEIKAEDKALFRMPTGSSNTRVTASNKNPTNQNTNENDVPALATSLSKIDIKGKDNPVRKGKGVNAKRPKTKFDDEEFVSNSRGIKNLVQGGRTYGTRSRTKVHTNGYKMVETQIEENLQLVGHGATSMEGLEEVAEANKNSGVGEIGGFSNLVNTNK